MLPVQMRSVSEEKCSEWSCSVRITAANSDYTAMPWIFWRIERAAKHSDGPSPATQQQMSTPHADQQSMLALLGSGNHGAGTLSVHLNWDINRCLDCLTALEVSGRVLWVSGGYTAVTVVAIHAGPV